MSDKDLKIKTLSKYRYRELKYFCLQYRELKDKLKQMPYESVRSMQITDMPSGHKISDTVQSIAVKRLEIERKIKAIEQSAIEADSGIYKEILYNVTEGISYHYLNVPCCKEYFYKKRKLFFNILDKKI